VKAVVLDKNYNLLFSAYQRHLADAHSTTFHMLNQITDQFGEIDVHMCMTGSGSISAAENLNLNFVQEMIACTHGIETLLPHANVAIELGGEDAKITFFDAGGVDQRMNETCAGGTGAFIDQIATLLRTDAQGLDRLAKDFKTLYPIAARCGVFAKTDIQPLLNEGASRNDIAASVFQAVVDQTVGGLACGRSIRGNIAFLGGPLYFLSQLRARFIDTLNLTPEQVLFPSHSQLFVALGAAIISQDKPAINLGALRKQAHLLMSRKNDHTVDCLPPLFANAKDKNLFYTRHNQAQAPQADLADLNGPCFLGIDVGSTTTKAVIMDQQGRLLHSWYDSNHGNPLQAVRNIVTEMYELLPPGINLGRSAVTGYGEALIKAALGVDEGEVETLAHAKAAHFFQPEVSFILDIGGQDVKCMHLKDGSIDSIMLNEACSSGCGSFLQTFATSLNMEVEQFARTALTSHQPVDLGSRCTVFMNSKVKHAQKEGMSVADISAGLAYSVVRNALYKVIKIRRPEDLGSHVVVQGGTFHNDAVLRAFELSVGREVVRPNISGLMGAFGAALIAKERWDGTGASELISAGDLKNFKVQIETRRCPGCGNRCLITINHFSGGHSFTSGNRCEKGVAHKAAAPKVPNLYEWKYNRLFNHYRPLPDRNAFRGRIGLPRVLNMYDNYPFWFTFFSRLGFRVELSKPSSRALYNTGLETISSQTLCYPAKMVHGHILDLIRRGVPLIFYPCINKEQKLFADVHNHFNCPVVASYPEVIRLNMDALKDSATTLLQPFLPYDSPPRMAGRLHHELKYLKISRGEINLALSAAYYEQENFRREVTEMGRLALQTVETENLEAIVLTGHPYHLDPAINHGIPQYITSQGLAVLSEDAVAYQGQEVENIQVVDQWAYHSRQYRAAAAVARNPRLQLVQLSSFGCGLDAISSEQVSSILEQAGKVHTLLKIDEGNNMGVARIRIRSLMATMRERSRAVSFTQPFNRQVRPVPARAAYTKDMRATHTILATQMSPYHFQFLKPLMESNGYRLKVLPHISPAAVEEGLRLVNNDVCYPALMVVGQLMHAVQTSYRDQEVALIISQTGGGCRATNYITFLRQALHQNGLGHIPVISFNLASLEDNPGFQMTRAMAKSMTLSLFYGDMLMRLLLATRPHELFKGSANALFDYWSEKAAANITGSCTKSLFSRHMFAMARDFSNLALDHIPRPKVGIVGEIFVKYNPDANNSLVDIIEREGGEAHIPDLADFLFYCLFDQIYSHKYLSGSLQSRIRSRTLITILNHIRAGMRKALAPTRFGAPLPIDHLARMARPVVNNGNQSGEGWLLTAEMMELLTHDVKNIICAQPFACLPNHITGKGVMKELKRRFQGANIVALDYDPGASPVNQLNRIKLMMSMAFKHMQQIDRDRRA
jgi:predicted CoA-substrate-specific enzyme activase